VSEPRELVIRGGTVITVEPGTGILPGADILVRDGRIAEVGRVGRVPGAVEVDASRMLVMPGLVETHWHLWSSLGRNFVAEDFEYFPAKWATSAAYEPDDFYRSVSLGLAEALAAGITTVHNWSHNTRSPDHADAELSAHRDIPIRARYAYGHRDFLPVDEPLDFADIDRVREAWFGEGSDFTRRVHLGVNLRGPDLGEGWVFDREMAEAQARKLPVAIHTVQGGSTAVDAVELERKGYLGPTFLIAHFLAANAADRAALARTRTPLSYSVHSELRLGEAGDARAALLRMLADGVDVSFSIDATSISPVDLFQAMNVAWNLGIPWLDSPTASLPALTFRRCLEIATIAGARALGLGAATGSLAAGKLADIVLIRADDLNVAPVAAVESTLVRSATPANVDTVLVGGRIVKRAGELVDIDRASIVKAASEAAQRVRERAGGRVARPNLAPDEVAAGGATEGPGATGTIAPHEGAEGA
jgi:5-methylthioadenosine/S-adenosylhomocysteine deaminase